MKKYKERVIEMVGLESCGHCADTEKFITTELKPHSDVPVQFKKIDANTPEGLIVKEKKLKYAPLCEGVPDTRGPNKAARLQGGKQL